MDNFRHPGIDLSTTKPIVCENCDGLFFQEALTIRKVSSILTASTKPQYIPIPVFVCNNCGHVNSEFLPKIEPAS